MEELRDKRGLTEAEAIARYRSRNYPKPALTADILVFRREGTGLKLLLIRRGGHPYLGKLALPGGFANENEPVEATAARELFEETGVEGLQLQLVGIFSAPGRDPRGWVVSAADGAVIGYQRALAQHGGTLIHGHHKLQCLLVLFGMYLGHPALFKADREVFNHFTHIRKGFR